MNLFILSFLEGNVDFCYFKSYVHPKITTEKCYLLTLKKKSEEVL